MFYPKFYIWMWYFLSLHVILMNEISDRIFCFILSYVFFLEFHDIYTRGFEYYNVSIACILWKFKYFTTFTNFPHGLMPIQTELKSFFFLFVAKYQLGTNEDVQSAFIFPKFRWISSSFLRKFLSNILLNSITKLRSIFQRSV